MRNRILDLIDFEKVDTLLEGFNKSTGFVTAILDLDGNVLSKSGWRQICTDFHRINPETSKKCIISDTELANKMAEGEKYHFYQCLNGLVDVAVPIVIKGEHIANLFSGQFFFEEPDSSFFNKNAEKFGFNQEIYLKALKKVPVVSKEKVLTAMNFLLNMTEMISDMTFQKLEQMELNKAIQKNERILRLFVEHSPASIAMFDNQMCYLVVSNRFFSDYNLGNLNIIGRSHYEVFPEISERWKEFHRRGLAGETIKESNDSFPRADGRTDWVRWEIRPWYETGNQIGGIILFSEVITEQIESREALMESEKYNRMLFEQSAIGLALTSMNGKNLDINPAYANMIGRTIEEAKELTYWEITPGKYLDQEQQQLKSLNETGYYGPYEKEYIHKDGHLIPVSLEGKIIERNGVKYIWSSVKDITERKRADEKLRINDVRLKKGQEIGHFGYWQQDIGSDVIWASGEAMKIYGFPPVEGDLSRNTIAACIRDVELVRQTATDLIVSNKNYDIEFEIEPADGSPSKIISAVAELERDNDGVPVRIMGVLQDITDRKKAEESLIETTANLKSLIDNRDDSIWSLDRNFKYLIFNSTYEKIFNSQYNVELKKGMNSLEFLTTEETYFWKPKFESVFEGESITFEFSVELKSGFHYFQTSLYPIIEDNIITGASAISIDITDRKKAEIALQLSEEKFSDTFYSSPAAMSITSTSNGLILDVNNAYLNLFEFNREEVIGHASLEINVIGPEEHSIIMQKIKEKGGLTNTELTAKSKSGKNINLLFSSKPITIMDDACILTTMIDITDRKQAEKALLESERRFRETLENVHLISAQIHFSGEVIYCNPYLCELTGYSREEIVGNDWFSKFVPDIPDVKEMFLKALQSGEIEALYENPIRLKDGTERIIRFSNTILLDPEGKVIGTTCIGEDITERKLAEAEIKTLNQTLERRVIERTAQLQAVNKELETFTYSVSHDLKAPLRGIDGYSKLLIDIYGKDLNEEAKTFLSTIRSSTKQMNQLIEDLLEYSRLERSQLSSEKIKIKDLINSIISVYKNELNLGNYSLKVDVPDIKLVADLKGLTIALRNILENAIKFTKGKANPAIEIGLEEKTDSWILRIKDNGIGFDMKYHQRIFEIFQRLQRAEDFQGTGVGLAMVSKAMQRMEGKAWAESAPGLGAIFYLEIPK